MKSFLKSIALCFAMLISVVFFFLESTTVFAADNTDLSNPDFGEVTDVTMPDSIANKNSEFTFAFGFHINDADSFPDGTFTYTLPKDLDFSQIVDMNIPVSRGEDEIGYAEIDSSNVITFHFNPDDFKNEPNGVDGSVAITCKLGGTIDDDASEAEIRFSEDMTYKITIDKTDDPSTDPTNPDPTTPVTPTPDPGTDTTPSFTATLTKDTVVGEGGVVRDIETGIVKWTSTLNISGDEEGYSFTITDSINPNNSTNGYTWTGNKKVGANIVTDSVEVRTSTGELVDNATVTYSGNTFTIAFENLKNGEYTITYSTRDYTNNDSKPAFPSGNSIDFKNTIKVGTPGVDVSATASYNVTTEGLPMRKGENGGTSAGRYDNEKGTYIIPWYIYVNSGPNNHSISSIANGSQATITDVIPEKLHYIAGSSYYIASDNSSKVSLDPVVETEGSREKLTWNFTWDNSSNPSKYYKLCFETYVDKDYYDSIVNGSSNGNPTMKFTNTATGVVGTSEGSATGSSNDALQVLVKTASFDEKNQLINYAITVNAKGLTINNGNEITLTDELTNGSFVTSSFQVFECVPDTSKAGTYKAVEQVAIDESKVLFSNQKTKLTALIPDGKALIITYSVKPDKSAGTDVGNGKVSVEVKNNVALSAATTKNASTGDNYKMNKVSANISSKNGSITITKVDKENHENKLSGAEIALYKVNLSTGEETLVSTKTTSAPFCFVKFKEDGSYNSLIFDTLYYYKEAKAPEGYQIDEAKHYFLFASSKYKNIKDQVASYVNGSDLQIIDVKVDTEYETVLENSVKTAPAETPIVDPAPQPADNGNGSNGAGTSASDNNSSDNASTDDGSYNNQSQTSTASAVLSARRPSDLPEVLGEYLGDGEVPSALDLPEVLGVRDSDTGDNSHNSLRVLVLLSAVLSLSLLVFRKRGTI